jgi:O-antigen ligase
MTILALFYLLQLTATLGAENRISAFHSLLRYTQIYLMVFFLSLGVSYRRYDIRLLTVFLAFQALLSAGHWILQSANLGGINTRGVISSRELTVFAGVHRLAFALPGLIPILVSGWVTYPRSRITRWVFVGSILLVVLAVLLTYSRLGFFGMIIAGGLIFLSMRQLLPWHQMAHLSLFILIGFIVLAFAFQSHEILWDRIEETYYTQSDESLRRRIILTKASLTFIAKNPMLGLGPGDFALGEGEFGFPKTTHATHNVYLQVAVESGVPSLLIFFALMALLFAKAYTQLKNLSIYHPGYSLLAGCLISLIVYLIEGMADSVGLRSIHFWYIIALTLGVVSALSMKDLEIPSYKSPQP